MQALYSEMNTLKPIIALLGLLTLFPSQAQTAGLVAMVNCSVEEGKHLEFIDREADKGIGCCINKGVEPECLGICHLKHQQCRKFVGALLCTYKYEHIQKACLEGNKLQQRTDLPDFEALDNSIQYALGSSENSANVSRQSQQYNDVNSAAAVLQPSIHVISAFFSICCLAVIGLSLVSASGH